MRLVAAVPEGVAKAACPCSSEARTVSRLSRLGLPSRPYCKRVEAKEEEKAGSRSAGEEAQRASSSDRRLPKEAKDARSSQQLQQSKEKFSSPGLSKSDDEVD